MRLIRLLLFLSLTSTVFAQDPVRILLVGDSTTIGSLPREVNPDGPQLEGMMEQFAAIEGLPELEIINSGKGGETAKRLLGSKWYQEKIATVPDLDYIILRMGINDWFRCEDFPRDFPVEMKALLAQLRKDHPDTQIILATICRFMPHEECVQVNEAIAQIARDEDLALFDLYTPYQEFLLANGEHALNVRQPYLDKIPEEYHEFLKPYTHYRKGWGNKPSGNVVKVDGPELDPLFGHLKSWHNDRHPSTIGYRLIAFETVKFLKPLLVK